MVLMTRRSRLAATTNFRLTDCLREFRISDIRDWMEQLISQDFLRREGEYNVLKVTDAGWQVLRGQTSPMLSQTLKREATVTRAAIVDSWEGVDTGLFEQLRAWRRTTAAAKSVPPYIVFGDVTLRDLARRRPTSLENLQNVHGIGSKKLDEFGADLIDLIETYCVGEQVAADQSPIDSNLRDSTHPPALEAYELFAQGDSVEVVAKMLSRAESTVGRYLEQYILHHSISDVSPWIDVDDLASIRAVAQYAGVQRLKPLYDALHGRISYDQLRIAVAALRNQTLQVVPD